MMISMKRYVPDTSVIVDGRITEMVAKGILKGSEIIMPMAVISELENQANNGRETGFIGLKEVQNIRELSNQKQVELVYRGDKPRQSDIKGAHQGQIDSMIRDIARAEGAILISSDLVQSESAKAEGIEVMYIEPEVRKPATEELKLISYFDATTMSVHLKEGTRPQAKKGRPGDFKLVEIASEELSREDIKTMIKDIIETAKRSDDGFMEISRKGATVVQLGRYRITITEPPFSNKYEITVVHPIMKANLSNYRISPKLMDRLENSAEGVLIAGPPGAGKSTFCAALAEFYLGKDKIVKTMESPRDLQVSKGITQYTKLENSMEKTAEILLLVRPDYTVYDEMRTTSDFEIYADMRLAGVGMLGVVHATRPIDTVERLINRVELGVIPHIVDTIIFIKAGEIQDIYELRLSVKVPSGMVEQDLARPVVECVSFETGEVKYEIYSYGEEKVVIPIIKMDMNKANETAARIIDEIEPMANGNFDVEMVSDKKAIIWADEDAIPRIIGKKGKMVDALERKFGVKLDVMPRRFESKKTPIMIGVDKEYWIIAAGKDSSRKKITILAEDQRMFQATVDKNGEIRISIHSKEGKMIDNALRKEKEIYIEVA